ncbi:MAG: arginase family protein [Francisellaceae bacterium]|nr:arginase family protein [Francisellaceae bacterium]MBT6538369.1 arginase family protein [Francisellaceae bacterium]
MNRDNLLQQLLCPPGDGVYTVHTAQEYKQSLQQLLYKDSDDILSSWQQSITNINSNVGVFGIASDCGGGILRGANWGPLFVREQLYRTHTGLNITDLGDVRVIPHLLHDKYLNKQTISSCQQALYGNSQCQLPVSPLSIAELALDTLYQQNSTLKIFGIGGDHSVSYPLINSYLKTKAINKTKVGILHFDAHTDLLTSRLGIDLCFGSWATHILPFLNTPECLVQVGIRATGKPKKHWEDQFGIKQIWAQEVQEHSALSSANQIIQHFKNLNINEIYITFDIDCLDASIASATGTPEINGLTLEQATTIINTCAKELQVTGADLVEVAPFTNPIAENKVQEPQATLSAAANLAAILVSAMQQ